MTNVYTDQGTACSLFECLMIMSYTFFFENVGAPWSSGAWGPGPNGPVVNPPLATAIATKKHIIIGTNKLHNFGSILDVDLLRNTRKTY